MTDETQTTTVAELPQAVPAQDKPSDARKLRSGMTVRVHEKIKDVTAKGEERERIQIFEGLIIAIRGSGISKTVTVHKMSEGVGVEKIYPVNSPIVAKIEIVKQSKVRRAKLTYLTNTKKKFRRTLKEKKA